MSCAADFAAQTVEDWISASRFPIHSKLPPERELATALGLSRGALRSALRRLEDDGRIWRHVGVGTYVGGRPASVDASLDLLGGATTLAEILEARLAIEPAVARLAATRAEPADIEMLGRYASDGAEALSWTEWERRDDYFHRLIAEASGNGVLISVVDRLFRIKLHPRWSVKASIPFDRELVRRYSREHAALLSAITARDAEAAEAAMREHIVALSRTIGPVIASGRRQG